MLKPLILILFLTSKRTMAWRSHGKNNAEMVRNLKGKKKLGYINDNN